MIPKQIAKRRIITPADLRVGDEVFVFCWFWQRASIRRIVAPTLMRGKMSPRRCVLYTLDGHRVSRPDAEVVPIEFVVRRETAGNARPPESTKLEAVAYAAELWSVAKEIGGVVV